MFRIGDPIVYNEVWQDKHATPILTYTIINSIKILGREGYYINGNLDVAYRRPTASEFKLFYNTKTYA